MTAGLPGTPKRRRTKVYRTTVAAILIMTITAAPVRAEDGVFPLPEAPENSSVDQVIYKGVVGNLLEVVPLPVEQRLQLQRGNAVVSNTLTGRSLAVLLGLTSPVLMIGGLIWGIWSAANIKAATVADAAPAAASSVAQATQPPAAIEAVQLVPSDADATSDPAQLAKSQ
jgi:hypothetical protein